MFKEFWLCFVPLFVAVDAIGVLPLFVSLTEGLERPHVHRIIRQSLITACATALVFLFIGPRLLFFLGITVADFMIAGGLLLLVISLTDILLGGKRLREVDPDSLGAVPIGVPLIAGPAVFATSILLVNAYGNALTVLALVLNIIIVGIAFRFAGPITRLIGNAGSKIVSRIAALLLASIAIMLIRKGVIDIVQGFTQ